MKRRTVLQSLAGGTGFALAGCTTREASTTPVSSEATSSTGTRTTNASSTAVDSRNHTVTVTKRTEQGQRGLARVLRIREGGRLEYTLTCADGTSTTTTGEVSGDRWREFEQLVLEADVSRFASEYECSGDCPRDLPQTRLTVLIDGVSTVVHVEAAAEIPETLDAVLTHVESFEKNLDELTCS